MITKEIKDKYIEIIDSLNLEGGVLDSLKNFVLSYDGSDTPEFHKFILETLAMIVHTNVLEEKAEVFDEIEKLKTAGGKKISDRVLKGATKEDFFNIPVPTSPKPA